MPNVRDEVKRALDVADYDGVLARLEPNVDASRNEVLECVGLTEKAGDELSAAGDTARAVRFWRLAHAGWEVEASMATGGGEGRQRMRDVERVAAKIARASAPPP